MPPKTAFSPAVSASDVTSTATVSPMPKAVMSVVPFRSMRLRML